MKSLKNIIKTVILTIACLILAASVALSVFIVTVRGVFNDDYIHYVIEMLDYDTVQYLDEGGSPYTMQQAINGRIEQRFGFIIPDGGLNSILRDMHVERVVADYLCGVKSWFFGEGPVPILDHSAAADEIAENADTETLKFLYENLGKQTDDFVSSVIYYSISGANFNSIMSNFSWVRMFLSAPTFVFALSGILSAFLLIFLLCGKKLLRALTLSSIAASAGGLILTLCRNFLAPAKRIALSSVTMTEETYDIFHETLLAFVRVAGIGVIVVALAAALLWTLVSVGLHVRRVKKIQAAEMLEYYKSRAEQMERMLNEANTVEDGESEAAEAVDTPSDASSETPSETPCDTQDGESAE